MEGTSTVCYGKYIEQEACLVWKRIIENKETENGP